jgi:hypothetical protein
MIAPFANKVITDKRSNHRTPESVAERLCRATDRFDTSGMSGSCGNSQPTASASSAEELLCLLSLLPDASGAREGCTGAARHHGSWQNHRHSASRRAPPSLRTQNCLKAGAREGRAESVGIVPQAERDLRNRPPADPINWPLFLFGWFVMPRATGFLDSQ